MPRGFGYLMIVEAATFLVASLLHLTVEWEPGAAGPEALIGVVMAVGAFFALRGRRAVALWTSGFAAFGTVVGITAISSGPGPKSVPDLTYHGLILTTLIVSIVLMARTRPRRVPPSVTPNA
ncbi:hypothetical protein [Kutzneria kofuensis]|uniref:Peptidoglycan/LPS O-acetylase OafA/YrhL n=1 Tax=Kutzneria kofuensis TaxID=103725 RepID=A0A7W9NGP0_9PSEU|nr:hypothetical protein [Kutzneria kofuensis]MBB5891744.1 peptidoglycan/LPS O-acetylase OafA/YrhL [Kutzneria kofuensis]